MAISRFLDPKNDVAFKKVFGSEKHKDILIHFINDILELKGNDQIEGVEFLSPVQNAEIAYKKLRWPNLSRLKIRNLEIQFAS